MDDLESKINAVLGNPEMMQTIMQMAQSFGQSEPEAPPSSPWPEGLDLSMVQQLGSLASQSQVDKKQLDLLHALSPYLQPSRVRKLEKAMRAAKMATLATTLLPQLTQGR